MGISSERFREILVAATQQSEIRDLVKSHVLEQSPAIFDEQPKMMTEVQRYLSDCLGVEQDGIRLVGSGALGYSIAPDNFGRPFHSRSDLDFAVVSPDLFDLAWTELLRWAHHRRLPPESEAWLSKRRMMSFGVG